MRFYGYRYILLFPLWMNMERKKKQKRDHFIVFTYLLLFLCCVLLRCDVVIVCTKEKRKKLFPNHDKRYKSSLIFPISSLLSFAYWIKSQKFNNMYIKVLRRCCLILKYIISTFFFFLELILKPNYDYTH